MCCCSRLLRGSPRVPGAFGRYRSLLYADDCKERERERARDLPFSLSLSLWVEVIAFRTSPSGRVSAMVKGENERVSGASRPRVHYPEINKQESYSYLSTTLELLCCKNKIVYMRQGTTW